MFFRFRHFYIALIVAVLGYLLLQAQDSKSKASNSQSSAKPSEQNQGEADPLQRAPKNDKDAVKEKLGGVYKKWLEEDVRWIITDEELSTFKKLTNNAERDAFIELFWRRRDPTPDTAENEYKEEHYRRIAYANEHFAAGIPGWKTDRGRIYIMYGKPDSIDTHPMGGPYHRPAEEGGGDTETYPFEVWRYRYLEGVGQEIEIEFVDDCQCGAYEMTMDRSRKDALLHIPNAGLTDMESMGMATKADRFRNPEALGQGFFNQPLNTREFDRLETFAKLNRAPEVKYNADMAREIVSHKFRTNPLPFDVRVDFVKLTSDTVMIPIAVQVPLRSLTWANKDGVQRSVLSVYGQMTTLGGKIVQTFDAPLKKDIPQDLLEKEIDNTLLYGTSLIVRPGLYRLDVVAKDVNGDKVGVFSRSYNVPDFSNDEKLASSTLILADRLEPVPSSEIGTGSFVIGQNRVRPRVQSSDGKPASFKKEEKLGFWMQVYNLGIDEKTKKPAANIEYQIVNTSTNKPVIDWTESTAQMGNVGEQVTLAKILPLSKLDSGTYQVTIRVNDQVSNQSIAPTARFVVQ
jgi:GWxTD domain-containing protein